MSRGGRTIRGRRGPLRKIVELVRVPRTTRSGREYDVEYEALECGHARHSPTDEEVPESGRRHCRECVKEELGWSVLTADAVRARAEEG